MLAIGRGCLEVESPAEKSCEGWVSVGCRPTPVLGTSWSSAWMHRSGLAAPLAQGERLMPEMGVEPTSDHGHWWSGNVQYVSGYG